MASQKKNAAKSKELIADFSLGYADGWYFKVGDWAKSALSMDRLPSTGELVQGCSFNFTQGSLFHHGSGSPESTVCSVQVVAASPAGRVFNGEVYSYDSGQVVFELFEPVNFKDSEGDRGVWRFVWVASYRCNQLQFIEVLKTGPSCFESAGLVRLEKRTL